MHFLSTNSMVEVRSNKPGLEGAWYKAKILDKSHYSNKKAKFMVEFQNESNQPEIVDISNIRPLPPPSPPTGQTYKPGDVVDALCGNGWWKGVVSKVEIFEDNKTIYRVVFQNPHRHFDFSSRYLRLHLIWSYGIWVRPPIQEVPNTEDCGKNPAHFDNTASHSNQVVPQTEETLSNHVKDCRKENSVISLTPLTLMKSTEQVTGSTLSKCSMRNSDTNLPLDTSSNHQEVGPENRREESSKKSERELNAQITGEKDAAAGGQEENVEKINQSSAVHVQADSDLVQNQEIPFTKSSFVWNYIDSLEVFQFLPQKPHFRPLVELKEEIREGSAIGHMLTFATLVEEASKLEIEKPASVFDSYLEALADLEMLGFDIKAVLDCITELLSFKRRQEQLENRSVEFQEKIAECDGERSKLEEEINEIDKMMSELKERQEKEASRRVKEESKRNVLQFNASTIKDDLLFLKEKFKVKAAALGRISNEKQ